MKNFVLVGAAGYIAPQHFKAIKNTKNNLVAAYDIAQNVGVIDSYFPEAKFFFNYMEFKKYLFNNSKNIDYLVICTPNYLHFKYISLAISLNLNVICEKPLVLNIHQLKKLKIKTKKYKKNIFCILQLRLNKNLIALRSKLKLKKNIIAKVDYITYRGEWFFKSWKGNPDKSGGLSTNIGIHLFDILIWLFGEILNLKVIQKNDNSIKGILYFKRNNKVSWRISLKKEDLRKFEKKKNFFRLLTINKKKIEFSDKFRELHTESYKNIIKGNGFKIEDVESSLELCNKINNFIV